MVAALEHFLKRLYEISSSDVEAYTAHLAVIEKAFDLHAETLKACRLRTSEIVFNKPPYCWNHVNVQHGMLMEDIDDATPIATHKPVMIIPSSTESDSQTTYYAQAFFTTMIHWTDDKVHDITSLYSSFLLKQAECGNMYSLAASMSITWADDLQAIEHAPKDWEKRFHAFGILVAKYIPCPHACGRLVVMGPEYFEQIRDDIKPNAHITPNNWSIPFGVTNADPEHCVAHNKNAVTYSQADIKAGSYVRLSFINPLVVKKHPCHTDGDTDGMCMTLLALGTAKLNPAEVQEKITQMHDLVRKHLSMISTTTEAWPSPFSSVALTVLTALCSALQQADSSMPEMKLGIDVLIEVIPLLNLPYKSWYFGMFIDLQEPCYKDSIFDSLRTVVRRELLKSWGHADMFYHRLQKLSYQA